MIKAVFFDLDGTLIDTQEVIIKGFKYLFDRYLPSKKTIDEEDYKQILGPALKDSFKYYFGPDHDFDLLLSGYRLATNDLLNKENIKLVPRTAKLIKILKNKGIRLAVITSRQHISALRVLKVFNLVEDFDVIIGCTDVQEVKPHPESFNKALKALNIKANEAIMIGDTANDIVGAKRAGIKSYAVKWATSPLEELLACGATGVIEDMMDIVEIVEDAKNDL
ncbi:HAD-IA family hydrolase [bacterium]|jgi:pyrophosphatase PpaX|nr:HAD-IA family hydrolase [bacterium]